jgi:hypothetical protein
MLNRGNILEEIKRVRKGIKELPLLIGNDAEKFFKDGFRKQAWQGDNGDEKWDKRQHDLTPDRPILIGKGTANLKKGLRKFVAGNYIAVKVTGIAVKYADVHNFGATIKVRITKQSRKFAWAMFYKTGNEMYKAMALTKKDSYTVKIKRRQFLGPTKQLDAINQKRIDKMILPENN